MLATLYVAPTFAITNDVAPPGLSAGDTVTWDSGKPDQQSGLTFGTNAFSDIQTAVNAAASGDTIQVAAGLYQLSAPVSVTTPLTILGPQANVDPRPSAGSTRVEGGPNEAVLDGGGTVADTFVIGANNVTINGFDLRDTLDEVIDTNPAAVYSNAQILDNFVHHAVDPAAGKGIRFQGVTNAVVNDNDVYDVRDTGIEIGSGSAGSSPGAVVSDNEVHDLGSAAATNSALYAFAVPFATNLNVTFQGNLIYNFGGNDAIKVGAKNGADRALTGGSVLDNVVHDVVEDGITIDASNTLVQGNEIYNSSSDNAAIYVEHSNGGDTIENNYVHNNTAALAAILIGDTKTAPTGVVVSDNSIVNNAHNLLLFRDLGSGNTVDASANWWGSADPTVVAASVVSTTPGQVDFTPWLNSGTDTAPTTPGFQPDFSALTVAPAAISPEFGAAGRINEGIQDVAVGGTVTVLNGNYNEGITFNKQAVVAISGTVNGTITGTLGTVAATGPLTLGDGTAGAINTSSALNVGSQTVTLSDSNTAVLGGVGLAGGTLTATNGIDLVPTPVVGPPANTNPLALGNTGILSGAGTVNAVVNVAGTGAGISPSASAGTLTVTSATFNSDAAFNVGINGTTPGTGYSQLIAGGGVNLNGATLGGSAGFTPIAGQTFEIINNTSANPISGTFAGLPEGAHVALGNAQFTISYTGGDGNDVVLTAVNATPTVSGVVPPRLVEGSGDTTITVNGTGFVNGSTVQFNGQPLTTTFVSATQLTAVVPAADMSEEGAGSVTVVTPGPGGGTSTATSVPIDDAPLTAMAVTLSATEASSLTGAVASFTDADPNGTVSDYTATIDWGDGTSVTGSIAAGTSGGFDVSGTHAYAEDGTYTVSVKITDAGGATATATSSVTVTEPELTGASASITGQERVALGTVPGSANSAAPQAVLATFTHGPNLEAATDFTTTINWGDGTTSVGTVVVASPAGTGYQVLGAHTYLDEGTFAVTVTINDEASSTVVHSTAKIAEEPLPGGIQGTATQRWINEVYRDLLGRPVDAGALKYWTTQAADGEKLSQIVSQIEQSGTAHEYYHVQVQSLYARYLHRTADTQGLNSFVTALVDGATLDQVAASIVGSPEFYRTQGGGSDSGFLNALYQDALGRPIDAQGMSYFEQQLSHEGHAAVAAQVFGSPEYRDALVNEDFMLLLDRPAEASAQSFYAGQLAHGTSNDAILAAIAASDEYFAKTA
ncbi:MAG TPA: DUF4214 domain-containing protein [Pirellulales bacterium]|nr:DUF4214 domain-containing protein [Pirellulales bacterium]